MMMDANRTALLVIDVQKAFEVRDARGDKRSNPSAEANIARLLSLFRDNGLHVVHVHHHSLRETSLFRAELPTAEPQAFVAPRGGERVYTKNQNSAFVGTSLHTDLRDAALTTLVICGATANHCVETTARMAGNFGFDVRYVGDAVWAYDAIGVDGSVIPAATMHAATLANIAEEFGSVIETADVVRALSGAPSR